MKKIFLLLLSFAGGGVVANAQTCNFPCTSLENPIYTAQQISVQTHVPYGKQGTLFSDVKYRHDFIADGTQSPEECLNNSTDFPDPNVDVLCGNDHNSVLYYDVYYPNNSVYSIEDYENCPLPCIIFFHGGSVSDCSNLHGSLNIAIEWARRGFVVFNVEYRRGRLFDPRGYYSVQFVLAFYRAFQDGRGAVRSIIKRQNNETTGDNWQDNYRINANAIFLAGASAGSAIAMNVAYYTSQTMLDAIMPGVSNSSVLGPVDANYYYGGTGMEYHTKIKGVLNMWGNVFVPWSFRFNIPDYFTNYVQNTYLQPLISFHGKLDGVATWNAIPVDLSHNSFEGINYNSETHCLLADPGSYSVDINANTNDLLAVGSNQLYEMLNELNIFTEFYLDCEMGHSLSNPGSRYFGLSPGSAESDANLYIMKRSATFFQAILTNSTSQPSVNKFTECENFSFGCNNDSNDGWSNEDDCSTN